MQGIVLDSVEIFRDQIAEEPTRATVNGVEMDVWWGPSEVVGVDDGADSETATMVCISDSRPRSPVGKGGTWTVENVTDYGGGAYEVQLAKE